MLAFGLLDVFFSMIWFFLFVMWIVLVIRVFGDIFRSDDMGGFLKVIWMLFVMAVPLLGVFMYIILRGRTMTANDLKAAQAQQEAFNAYVRQAAGSPAGVADELAKLAGLDGVFYKKPVDPGRLVELIREHCRR